MKMGLTSTGLGMPISWLLYWEVSLILVIKVLTRKFKVVGDKNHRLRKSVMLSDITLYEFESEPYGMTNQSVEEITEERLNNLRTSLMKNGINSKVIREDL